MTLIGLLFYQFLDRFFFDFWDSYQPRSSWYESNHLMHVSQLFPLLPERCTSNNCASYRDNVQIWSFHWYSYIYWSIFIFFWNTSFSLYLPNILYFFRNLNWVFPQLLESKYVGLCKWDDNYTCGSLMKWLNPLQGIQSV